MNEEINNKDYKPLTPFKGWVLENFPFIEADFDTITNYQLMCKITEYLNNVIYNQNEVQELATELVDGYNALLNYVNNYFENLDVQEEINNKLDEMAEDGTLTNLIRAYIDPLIEAQNLEISNFKTIVNSEIITIDNKVNSATAGTPKGVYATASALATADPDHNYIYVVSADGKWYYYDTTESDWVAGGTYQSTSIDVDTGELAKMLRGYLYITDTNGNLTDNDDLNLLNNFRSRLYYVTPTNVSNVPSSLTISVSLNKYSFITYNLSYNDSNAIKSQILFDLIGNKQYFRNYFNSWTTWQEIPQLSKVLNYTTFIYSSNVTDTNKNFNNIELNTMIGYYLQGSQMVNSPIPVTDTSIHYLNVMCYGYSNSYKSQIAIDTLGEQAIYFRNCNNNVWTDWAKLLTTVDNTYINNFIDYSYLTDVIQEPIDITNKTLTFAGDSITAGNFIGSTNVWAKWLSDKLNTTYSNKAVGGATFAYHEGYGEIIDQINNTTLNDVLFIAGGINDYVLSSTKADFTSAIDTLCDWLDANYNGTVIFVTPLNHVMADVTNTIPLDWYREEITRQAIDHGYSVINGKDIGFPTTSGDMATLMFYDDVHPSVTGQKVYANKVYELLVK